MQQEREQDQVNQGQATDYAALEVPEILIGMAHHLARKDFLNCLLVSHAWHAHLNPLLWHSMTVPEQYRMQMNQTSSSAMRFPSPAVLQKYAPFIRSLGMTNLQLQLASLVPYCTQLTRLVIMDLTVEVLPLIQQNKDTLQSLSLRPVIPSKTVPQDRTIPSTEQVLAVMEECRFLSFLHLWGFNIQDPVLNQQVELQRLKATSIGPVQLLSPEVITAAEHRSQAMQDRFYGIVHRLSTLILQEVAVQRPRNDQDVFYNLRDVRLLRTMTLLDQARFVSQCQYLTHLQLRRVGLVREVFEEELLARVQLAITCPQITHLDLSWTGLHDYVLAALLKQLPFLKSLNLERTYMSDLCLDLLTGPESNLRDSLEELNVTDVELTDDAWVQRLLCSCRGLKVFRATRIQASDIAAGMLIAKNLLQSSPSSLGGPSTVATAEQMFPQSPSSSSSPSTTTSTSTVTSMSQVNALSPTWVCLGLKTLQVSVQGLRRPPIDDGTSLPNSLSATLDEWLVHQQISLLTDLQVLSLGGSPESTWLRRETLILSLQSGLSQLSTLRYLRVFNFSYMEHSLTVVEVEWMMEHWPRLRKVIGTIRVDVARELLRQAATAGSSGDQQPQGPERALETRDGEDGGEGTETIKLHNQRIELPELYIRRKWPSVAFSSK
ncbi:hypothetical protein BGZ83_008609 [Gryganskiella cystojenkinii]|nr:hypothetical protein BGZ83_008609 [Gryganskiella cystojenkinii]